MSNLYSKILVLLAILAFSMSLMAAPALAEDDDLSEQFEGDASGSVTITTTINDNGNVTEESDVKGLLGSQGASGSGSSGGGDSGSGTSSDTSGSSSGSGNQQSSGKKTEDTEDLSAYNGLYNNRHIIPDVMAKHCRITGEAVAQNPNVLINCIKQYVSEMNNSNASAKSDAEKDYEVLRFKVLTDTLATAITKSQAILNYEQTMNKYNEADMEMNTAFDDEMALVNTLSFVTDVLNDIRELQVEQMKYTAINAIAEIDPSVVQADEEPEERKKSSSGSSGDGQSESWSASAHAEAE